MLDSDKPSKVNVRVNAASNRKLRDMVDTGIFCADLYYHLALISLTISALRDSAYRLVV